MLASICHLLRMTEEIRTCLFIKSCGKNEVHNGKRWQLLWHRYGNGWICSIHYSLLVVKTKQRIRYTQKKMKRKWYGSNKRILFLGKQIFLGWEIKIGECSWCGNNIFNDSCRHTHIHHLFYVPIMPWACTVELCPKCHESTMDN